MATKFSNNQARVFHKLLNGADFNELLKYEIEKINKTQYYCSEAEAQKYREQNLQDVLAVKTFFDKIKFFEKAETYKVNGWGYGQTNYENVKVLGQMGGSMACVIDGLDCDVYTVQKSKYINKSEWSKLDSHGVRTTDWQKPYSNDEIREKQIYNSYYGH